MKILLVGINAKYAHMNPALYSIRAFAGDAGKCMDIAEYTINQQPSEVLRDIYERHPDVIGFSCYIWNMRFIGQLLEDIKKILPKTLILLGGPEAAFDAGSVMSRFPAVDGVFTGEGEKPWKVIAETLSGNDCANPDDIGGITGLKLRGDLEPVILMEMTDLNDIPFIFYDIAPFENRMLYYETSRGCPFRCSYCLSSLEKRMRFRSLEKVYPELQHFLDKNVRIVKFTDRTFNADHAHAMGIWKYLEEHDNGISRFHFEIEADLLNDKELEFLKTVRKGLFQFEVGVQSLNPETLKAVNRHADTGKIEKTVKQLKSYGNIPVHIDLIAGLPFEDLQSFRDSFNGVYGWGADELQLGFLKVLKGTEIECRTEEFGLVYESAPPYEVLSTKWMSFDDLLHLKEVEEQLERYGNSGAFKFTIKEFEKYFSDPFAMYEYIAAYYRMHRERFHRQSRISAYSMLREMIEQRLREVNEVFAGFDLDHADIRHFDAMLLIDLYAKEKLKTRPPFIPGGDEQKSREREYIRANRIRENVHIEFFDFDVSVFINNEEIMQKETAVIFRYDGQGSASSIEITGEGSGTAFLKEDIAYDIKR